MQAITTAAHREGRRFAELAMLSSVSPATGCGMSFALLGQLERLAREPLGFRYFLRAYPSNFFHTAESAFNPPLTAASRH